MSHQAVILDFVKKSVTYVDVTKAANAVKQKKGTTLSATLSVPPSGHK